MNMQDQNSQYENSYFDYTTEAASTPVNTIQHPKKQTKRQRKQRRGPSFIGVLCCIFLSFAAGFAGSLGAFYLVGNYISWQEEITTPDVLCEDPESEISRPEANPSIYGSAGEDAFAVSGVVNKVEDAVVVNGGSIPSG